MVQVLNEYDGEIIIPRELLSSRWYSKVYKATRGVVEGHPSFDMTVILNDDQRSRELNKTYRKLDRTTDVLSFYYDDEKRGELFISIPQTKRQASRYKTSFEKEMLRLIVHGILHLYGYDHMKPAERAVMRSLERAALREYIHLQ